MNTPPLTVADLIAHLQTFIAHLQTLPANAPVIVFDGCGANMTIKEFAGLDEQGNFDINLSKELKYA